MSGFELGHAFLTAPGATPARWLLFLHGMFGSGANWRGLARRLVARRADWGAVLADLRQHGRSQGAPPPHSLAAAAGDVIALAEALAAAGRPVAALAGHSFGGKVALAAAAGVAPRQLWVLDSSPGPQLGALAGAGRSSTVEVLESLESLPPDFASRGELTEALRARGHGEQVAAWLAMNLVPHGARHRLRFELPALRALLTDYYAADLWSVVEAPPPGCTVEVVLGGRSTAVSAVERARLVELAAARPDRLAVHVLPDAGHWLHVDAPEALLARLAERLP